MTSIAARLELYRSRCAAGLRAHTIRGLSKSLHYRVNTIIVSPCVLSLSFSHTDTHTQTLSTMCVSSRAAGRARSISNLFHFAPRRYIHLCIGEIYSFSFAFPSFLTVDHHHHRRCRTQVVARMNEKAHTALCNINEYNGGPVGKTLLLTNNFLTGLKRRELTTDSSSGNRF